ncbi:MAG: Mut7-C RNAse domain-containing protein [Candidatus Micrarchaeaceae archaeon]
MVHGELVADVMLEKLARWIRLSGTSITSAPFTSDNSIIRYVKKHNGILLTQDEPLAGRSSKRKFKVLLVKGSSIEEQLAFVACSLGLKIRTTPSGICPYCNAKLVKIAKESAKAAVPNAVAKSHTSFYTCKKCKRVYWRGTHWNKISARLKLAMQIKNKQLKNMRNSRD